MDINNLKEINAIMVETAHPAKFKDVVEEAIKNEVEIPERLAACINKEKKSVRLDADYNSLKDFLMSV
jgi:threonine synthase